MTGSSMGHGRDVSRLPASAAVLVLAIAAALSTSMLCAGNAAEIGGSIRTYTAGMKNVDAASLTGEDDEYAGLSHTLLRLTTTGQIGTSSSYEVHALNGLDFSTGFRAYGLAASGISTTGVTRYRITNPSWVWAEDDDFRMYLTADRLNARYSLYDVDITLGRQAINFSQAYFWNPLDVFAPLDPQTVDRDYKPGVDALRADIDLGSFSSLSVVGALGRKVVVDDGLEVKANGFGEDLWYASALMARYRTTCAGWDLSFQAGKIYGGHQTGAGFSGEAGPLGIRGEAAYFKARGETEAWIPDPSTTGVTREVCLVEDHVSIVLGMDHRFDSSLYVNVEYFLNGAGDDDDLTKGVLKSAVGETLSLSEHLAGIQATYEFHPLLTGQATWIVSLSDASSLLSPSMTFSVADEADFIFGAMLPFGSGPDTGTEGSADAAPVTSEFGSYPHVFFMEFSFSF